MARLFNTSDLFLPFGLTEKKDKTLRVPQKIIDGKACLMPLDKGGNELAMIWLNKNQLQQLHRHIGGLLGLEDGTSRTEDTDG